MKITQAIKNKRLFFDGGSGTVFQSLGLKAGEKCEEWNITKPDAVIGLHKEYLLAGADIIKTNTFGANSLKFNKDYLKEIIKNAILNAKKAIEECNLNEEKYVALDIGPTGKLLKPLGDLEFEDAVKIFGEVSALGEEFGADLILIETFNDSYETKAAVIGAKENSSLPIFVTNAYDTTKKLMTGATPKAMISLLEGLGVDAIGMNCSFGPDKMLPIVEEYAKYSSLPIIVNPNAGLPTYENSKTTFSISADEFAKLMLEIAKKGATVLGGCCGTTPCYIKETKHLVQDVEYILPSKKDITSISSYADALIIDSLPLLIGERINPTGKPALKAALKENDISYILNEGVTQQEKGVHILDVNVGLPEIDEALVLETVVKELQSVCSLPLQIDTSNACAMEKALRAYNGKALINSVNGKKEVMDEIFPVAKKYGGVIIALTLDENGIPDNAEDRVNIALNIINEAKKYGIEKKDIIVDTLAMTVSSDSKSAMVTLKAISLLKKMGIKTALGVSNVSFGLPNRNIINSAFFTLALNEGLNLAIMNPFSKEMTDAYFAYLALTEKDENFEKYISYATAKEGEKKEEISIQNPCDGLNNAIVRGLKEESCLFARELLKEKKAMEIINTVIIPALDVVGKGFEEKKIFLPQLLMSASSAKSAFNVIKEHLQKGGERREKKQTVVIATVKGDIHDIGKNIVKVLLENYDYNVIDMGKDVPPQEILLMAKEKEAEAVALSALMTTTVPAMEETVKLIKENLPNCKTIVGGAVLTKEYASKIGADYYGPDAMSCVRYLESL